MYTIYSKTNKGKIMETYMVKFNRKKEDGFWKYGETETVNINKEGKDNHKMAEDIIKKKYPGCLIVTVTYC